MKLRVTKNKPIGSQPSLFGDDDVPVYAPRDVANGVLIGAYRVSLVLTVSQAARRLGLTNQELEQLERGELSADAGEAKAMMRRYVP